jgi:hypothetical protein
MPQMNGNIASNVPNKIIVISPFDPSAAPRSLQFGMNLSSEEIWLLER